MQVYFDPAEVTYEQLLDNFFDKVDPTTKDRQGNDMGTQYRSAIYYHTEQQKDAALKVLTQCGDEVLSSVGSNFDFPQDVQCYCGPCLHDFAYGLQSDFACPARWAWRIMLKPR